MARLNRVYVVVYDPALEPVVRGIGPRVGTPAMWRRPWRMPRPKAARPDDVFAAVQLAQPDPPRSHGGGDRAYRQRNIGWPAHALVPVRAVPGLYEQGARHGHPPDQVMALTDQIEEVWYWRGRALAGREADAARAARAPWRSTRYRPALMALIG